MTGVPAPDRPEKVATLCEALSLGHSMRASCAYANVTTGAVAAWRQDERLGPMIDRAIGLGVLALERAALEVGVDRVAANVRLVRLARLCPDDWSPIKTVENTGTMTIAQAAEAAEKETTS